MSKWNVLNTPGWCASSKCMTKNARKGKDLFFIFEEFKLGTFYTYLCTYTDKDSLIVRPLAPPPKRILLIVRFSKSLLILKIQEN